MIRSEVLPIILGSISAMICYKYRTQILNLVLGSRQALNQNEWRFISKRISGLLKQSYKYGKLPMSEDLIEV